MKYCMIDSDRWEDCGIVYKVLSYDRLEESSGVKLTLEDPSGHIHTRTVAVHQIEWIEDES